ncbi:hypothetical protein ACX9NE_16810 [Mycobacterium sp. ML4]
MAKIGAARYEATGAIAAAAKATSLAVVIFVAAVCPDRVRSPQRFGPTAAVRVTGLLTAVAALAFTPSGATTATVGDGPVGGALA